MNTPGKITILLLAAAVITGCSAPTATLDLITFARKGIDSAAQEEARMHQEVVRGIKAQVAALDSAFDADVRRVTAGQIQNAEGEIVELSPEWVISARKGYIAVRDLLTNEVQSAHAGHLQRQDNLKATDEALEMASELIVRQWNVGEQIQRHLMNIQRKLIHD